MINQSDELISYFTNASVPFEKIGERFFALTPEEKKAILPRLSRELRSRLIKFKSHSDPQGSPSERLAAINVEKEKKAALKKPKIAHDVMEQTVQIKHLKRVIRAKAAIYRRFYNSCLSIGEFWEYFRNEITHSYNAIEMTMRLNQSIEQNDILKIRSVQYQETRAAGEAFSKILAFSCEENKNPITEEFIKNLHRVILPTEPTHAGIYRQIKVRLPNVQTVLPNYMKVPQLMKELIERDNKISDPIEKALRFHYDLVATHPFTDGNGRTARSIMNAVLIQNGLPPIVIDLDKRDEYIKSLETYSTKQNDVPFRTFMMKQLSRSLSQAYKRLKNLPHYVTTSENSHTHLNPQQLNAQLKQRDDR